MKQKRSLGFTLIELLVVIGIISLLASTVILALNSSKRRARDAKRLADVKQLSTAMDLFQSEYSGFPDSLAALAPDFMGQELVAPVPPDGNCTEPENAYEYTPLGTSYTSPKDDLTTVYPDFTITFCLGGNVESTPEGVHTLTPNGIE